MGDEDGFDAGAAAGRALGLDDNPGQAVDVDPGGSGDSVAPPGGSPPASEEGGGSLIHSLLFAPERGPTQATLAARGIGEDLALVLDGTVDWLLDVVGADKADQMGDNLGPLGKIALGTGGLLSSAGDGSGGDQEASDDDQEASADVGPLVGSP